MSNQKVVLACDFCHSKNYRIKKTTSARIYLKKYCKNCKKHTLHYEEK